MKKLPSFNQWKQIFKVLKKNEKITLLICFLLAIGSLFFLISNFYLSNTKIAPSVGGNYKEGLVGQPRFINPIYGETNDIDRSLIQLVFSGLMTYDKDGKIVKDLADSYKISDDGKTYEFKLKDNIFWHDGEPLTADDIIFTIKTIQNSDYKSPLRANWIDVEVEKISDKSLKLELKTPYNSFLENCTLKIIPKHIWQNILPENFILSSYNLQPIGSGPYEFVKIGQTDTGFIKSLNLRSYRKYYANPAFISNISFQFFEEKEDLIRAANPKEINGFTLASLENNESEIEKEISQGLSNNLPLQTDEKFSAYSFSLPRYFAVFFNPSASSGQAHSAIPGQKSSIFSDKNTRKALLYAVNKDEIIKSISFDSKDNISKVPSPILPDFFGYQGPSTTYNFDVEKAKGLLDKAGFKDNGNGIKEKAINKKPAFQFKGYLKTGSKSAEVNQLQSCLARLDEDFKNLLKDETSGTYGKATESAVTEFQK